MNFIIELVVYPFDIMFSIGEMNKKLKKALKARLVKSTYREYIADDFLMDFDIKNDQRGRCIMIAKHGVTVIRFGKKPTYGTIAHEIFHSVEFIMDRIQTPLNRTNDEAYAYLIGYITDQFYTQYLK